MIRASDLEEVEFTDSATIRLISTAYIDDPAIAPLADDDDDLAMLEEIEGLTSARKTATLPTPGGLNPAELLTEADGYGWAYVNAAFCCARATGNRFNGPDRGAWYASYGRAAVETSQAEVAWHLTSELEATGVFENVTAYRELLAGFTTRFHDLSGWTEKGALSSDPSVAYPADQSLARDVLASGGNGILYPSARYKRGQCLVALRPHLVQNVRQGDIWVFEWTGERTPSVRKE
ncbi:MAG: RES family NAD+ phosphorylase [Boseongicola sp.]|nr:RES family NAD+ phosphorylase [Boseongicola sp.]